MRTGKPRRFLQSLAKKLHSKETIPPPQPPLPTSKKTQKTHVRGSSECSVLANVMSQDDKDWITYNHNKKRAEVAKGETYGQPGASNMNALAWDDDLANDAAYWAFQCPDDHSGNGHGENIYWWAGQGYNIDTEFISQLIRSEPVEDWFKEHYNFNPDNIEPWDGDDSNGVVGHYTALVWADTNKVGCGYAYYINDGGWDEIAFVCNYESAGNVVGGTMYDQGYACEECDNCWLDALCY